MNNFQEKANFIWSVADLLRGDYKQSEYGRVVLPLTVLRRLDQVLAPSKDKVLAAAKKHKGSAGLKKILEGASGHNYYNTSQYTFETLVADPDGLALNLRHHINGYSENARKIIEEFRFEEQIDRLAEAKILYKVVKKFSEVDLHPDRVSNREMGYIFEELIRKFSEISNETAGEHFTPRDVVRLMVNILLTPDDDALQKKGVIRSIYDPACGTGGMLSVAEEHMRALNSKAELYLFGQELNPESYAICVSDLLITGHDPDRIKLGDSFNQDGLKGERFDYTLCNPPFGVEWKKYEEGIRAEAEKEGYGGRFGAGLPRINDGSLLFLQHMISKMKSPKEGGTRMGIVFNGSPLFTGGAGSGESEIRRWILENDWLEAIVALPDNMFYNTGISTYLWFLTNRKAPERKGKVQLIDASGFYQKMRKSLGDKRHEITDEQANEIVRLYGTFREGEHVKIYPTTHFGYRRVTIERPLRLNFQASPDRLARLRDERAFANLATSKKKGAAGAKEVAEGEAFQNAITKALGALPADKIWKDRPAFEAALDGVIESAKLNAPAPVCKAILSALSERDETANVCLDAKGKSEADADLRDTESVPLDEGVAAYVEREVKPFLSDAWVDETTRDEKDGGIGAVGYEINFNRYFYTLKPARELEKIDVEIRAVEAEILDLLGRGGSR